jgi:hypothetical protein
MPFWISANAHFHEPLFMPRNQILAAGVSLNGFFLPVTSYLPGDIG